MEFKIISQSELQQKLVEFKKCIDSDERLPKNIENVFLLRYLKFFNGNVDKAFKRLISSMELRKYYFNIFHNRDTEDSRFQKVVNQMEMILLPKLTPNNYRIILTRLINFDPDTIVFDDILSVSSVLSDVNLIIPENIHDNTLADGEILVYDLNGLTGRHLTKLGISSMRGFFRYMTEAHPMRIKQIHLINVSSLVDKIIMMIRPFISAKAMSIMHFHAPNSKTLFDFIPVEILPIEIGGTDETIETTKQFWIKKAKDYREYLTNDDNWTIKEIDSSEDPEIEDSIISMGFF